MATVSLREEAREYRHRIRFLQSHTTGWSGSVSVPAAGVTTGVLRQELSAEQPLTYPEIVGRFRDFLARLAAALHRNHQRVIIGIDELDKMGSGDKAQAFLNEIKALFGVPYCFYLISVSEDALAAFERRGLPLRDAFDSTFDEIIRVDYLDFTTAREVVRRRIIGWPEPFVCLCYCLSGGLARDLVRTVRAIVGLERAQAPQQQLAQVCRVLVQDDLTRKSLAMRAAASRLGAEPNASEFLALLTSLSTGPYSPGELLARARRLASSQHRREAEGEIGHDLDSCVRLSIEMAAYIYYCATLFEVFNDDLSKEQVERGCRYADRQGAFNQLASGRQTFAVNTRLAWLTISDFRAAWNLEVLPPPDLPQIA